MAKQTVNVGNNANDGSGDAARTAFTKLNQNNSELYSQLGADTNGNLPSVLPVSKGGTGGETQLKALNSLGLGNAPHILNRFNISPVAGKYISGFVKIGSTSNTPGSSSRVLCQMYGVSNWADQGSNVFFIHGTGRSIGSSNASAAFKISYLDLSGRVPDFYAVWDSTNNKADLYMSHEAFQSFIELRSFAIDQTASTLSGLWVGQDYSISEHWVSALPQGAVRLNVSKNYSTSNTTVDGNGYLKPSSPVVRLYADKVELINEAVGQDITFEKLGVGDYLVKNTTGLRDDGWYIETPKDLNGNVLVFVEFTQLENKDISVKTYKKKFDMDTASTVADHTKPMDIPTDRWIDLRFNDYPIAEQPTLEATS